MCQTHAHEDCGHTTSEVALPGLLGAQLDQRGPTEEKGFELLMGSYIQHALGTIFTSRRPGQVLLLHHNHQQWVTFTVVPGFRALGPSTA